MRKRVEGMYGGSSRVTRERAAAGMSAAAWTRCSIGERGLDALLHWGARCGGLGASPARH
ncbi:hypothetical protein M5W83_07765 [Paenibacillus thiaminolyticus]|uniref:Uncharacterized protein n=1 Tax=Paenibacillus thiaminolyticus TaxID=49283 RepID=A0AAP9DYB6_PANTH|nr:hypothetical protein [Paenibacillus thiaminolyticus]MCY9533863.1 hypothetical protein [Paenibacillus thiaminolyticus]MCY9601826.1 hypothetical protein [Paenibacillus thiaminolyticus]MCY9607042.1 hypothetical protein [Paenibacillus thiaminolyticus]MCY9614270.1 hypothetical protein [Paenibacillus thiaminolyticus]MCY9619173.1 hypothetical protein [Paenibacillus thiaminolyticus]